MSLEDKFGEAALNYRMATMGGAQKAFEELEKAARELFSASTPTVAGQAPEGWKLVRVNEYFDALIEALERAESKGYLPDALAERWANFACDENVTAPIAALTTDAGAALTDEQIVAIADDNDSGRTTSGRRLFSDRNLLQFARALLATAQGSSK